MAGLEPATSSFWTAVTPDTCLIQDINSADFNSARHGQFQEKEKNADYWIGYFPFEKNFRRKILKPPPNTQTSHTFPRFSAKFEFPA